MSLTLSSRGAIALAAAVAGALAPAAAFATPYEQVTRGSGPYATASTGVEQSYAQAVGDVGRYVGFKGKLSDGQAGAFIRDVQTNLTSQPGGTAAKEIFGIDRAETKVLVGRQRNGFAEVAVTPLAGGGTSKVIYTAPAGSSTADLSGALSGDGSTAAVRDYAAGKIVKINVATGATTQVQTATRTTDNAWVLAPQALSDNGQVLAVSPENWLNRPGRIYRDGQPRVDVGDAVAVSADGSTAVWRDYDAAARTYRVNVRKLANGQTKTAPLPAYELPWISADGNMLITNFLNTAAPNRKFDWATGAWSDVTGRFANYGGLRSQNGRFVVYRAMSQQILIDSTNTHIVGANDPVSADLYLNVEGRYWCGSGSWGSKNEGSISAELLATGPTIGFAPKAVKADVKLAVDQSVFKTATLTVAATPTGGNATFARFVGSPDVGRVSSTLTDEQGRVIPGLSQWTWGQCG